MSEEDPACAKEMRGSDQHCAGRRSFFFLFKVKGTFELIDGEKLGSEATCC